MENPISYSDLFSPDIQQGIEGLVSDIMRVEKQLKGMLESVKSEAQTLGEALAGVSSATKGGRDTTKADSAQVDKLYEAYTQLSKMYEENQKTLKALLGNHICRIIISLLLIALGIHWGLLGAIPFFIVYVMWDTILNPEQ